jgi:hypothetical protein
MMILKWLFFIWLSSGCCRSLWPWWHIKVLCLSVLKRSEVKRPTHTLEWSYGWVWNVEPDCICLTKALYWVFHWGRICRPKVWLLPIFWLQSGNKCFIPGVDSFWASWKVDSCLGLTEQVKWPMWCCERVSKGNQVNFFLAASIIGDADDLQWVKIWNQSNSQTNQAASIRWEDYTH